MCLTRGLGYASDCPDEAMAGFSGGGADEVTVHFCDGEAAAGFEGAKGSELELS